MGGPDALRRTVSIAVALSVGLLLNVTPAAYCRAERPTQIVLRAVDTSGNESAPSNAIAFTC